jgi:NitT/TauT family transport system ATP-binding protein
VADLITLDDVKKVYESRRGPVHAIGPLTITVEEEEFISFVGPSGCGKSTLLLLVAGLLDCTEGTIDIAGRRVTGPQTDVGIVFQSPVLVDWRDVLGNVLLQVEMRKLPVREYEARARELLGAVGLGDFLHSHPYELSGGMQQRTAFCRALVHDPPLVLMDEPLGALDAMTREQLRVDLETLWMRTRKTVLFVTHSIAEAIQLSDRVVVISPRPGKIERLFVIDLPRPRSMEIRQSEEFMRYVNEITGIFMNYGVL